MNDRTSPLSSVYSCILKQLPKQLPLLKYCTIFAGLVKKVKSNLFFPKGEELYEDMETYMKRKDLLKKRYKF